MSSSPRITLLARTATATSADSSAVASLLADLRSMSGVTARREVLHGDFMEGAKGPLEEVVLVIATSTPMIAAVVAVIRSWMARQKGRHLTLEIDGERIEVVGLTTKAQTEAVDAFIARHEK